MKYPLLPYSQLVWETTRWYPRVYQFPSIVRWRGGADQKGRVENAFRIALKNHPVFSMRVDWRGRQYAAFFKDILHGKYHDIDIYIKDSDLYVSICGNLILGDGKSFEVLIEDFQRAYNGLTLEVDDYWDYVIRYEKSKSNPHYNISRLWLINEFSNESVPVRPLIDRKWLTTVLPFKCGLFKDDYTNLHEKILQFMKVEYLSFEGIFSLCAALSIADSCKTDEAALTWAYEGRETDKEQHIYGSLHRDIPFKINHKSEIINHKSVLIREARNQIRSGIAHSDYPYTLTAPYSKRWNYAVNVLRVKDSEDVLQKISLPIEIVSTPKQKYAYALLDVEIHEKEDSLQLVYRYSATHYKPESIQKFAALVRKYVEWLID